MDCNSDSGNNLNWLRPVTVLLEQATMKADKIKKDIIFRIILIGFIMIVNHYTNLTKERYFVNLRKGRLPNPPDSRKHPVGVGGGGHGFSE